MPLNALHQAIGEPVPGWSPRQLPADGPFCGRYCRLEVVDVDRHADELYAAYATASDARDWTYLTVGPFADAAAYRRHAEFMAASEDPKHYVVIDLATQRAVGTLALMRIDPANGVIEVGWVTFSPLLQHRTLASEAHYLLMQHCFDTLAYRRYEWKCDNLNAPSHRAAQRLGFSYEGLFRQAIVYKGRRRDTAWYSIIDGDWPAIRAAFEAWLAPANFDAEGRQIMPLAQLRTPSVTVSKLGAGDTALAPINDKETP